MGCQDDKNRVACPRVPFAGGEILDTSRAEVAL